MKTLASAEILAAELFPTAPATYQDYEAAAIASDRARREESPDFERLSQIADATYWSYADGVEAKAGA